MIEAYYKTSNTRGKKLNKRKKLHMQHASNN